MGWHLLIQIEVVLTFFCCAFGLLKGGPAERAGALLILTVYVADDIAFAFVKPYFPTLIIFIGDFALAFGLLFVAIRYSSLWLGCAMLLQSVVLCSQGLAFGGDGLGLQDQIWLNNGISMLMKACVVAGAIASWHRRSKAQSLRASSTSGPFSVPVT